MGRLYKYHDILILWWHHIVMIIILWINTEFEFMTIDFSNNLVHHIESGILGHICTHTGVAWVMDSSILFIKSVEHAWFLK